MRRVLGIALAAAVLGYGTFAPAAHAATPAGASPAATTTPAAPPATYAAPVATAPAPSTIEQPAVGTAAARANYKSALDRAARDYGAARTHCRTLSGNEKSVCIAEAKVKSRNAEMNAEAIYRNTARARLDAKVVAANGEYAVAKARCNSRSGNERRACLKDAKTHQSEALSAAMRARG